MIEFAQSRYRHSFLNLFPGTWKPYLLQHSRKNEDHESYLALRFALLFVNDQSLLAAQSLLSFDLIALRSAARDLNPFTKDLFLLSF